MCVHLLYPTGNSSTPASELSSNEPFHVENQVVSPFMVDINALDSNLTDCLEFRVVKQCRFVSNLT